MTAYPDLADYLLGVGRPGDGFREVEFYPDVIDKAAVLCVRLARNHPLPDGRGGFGELPPVGGLFGLPLLFDQDLLAEDELYFTAGSLTASMVVTPRALAAVERPFRY